MNLFSKGLNTLKHFPCDLEFKDFNPWAVSYLPFPNFSLRAVTLISYPLGFLYDYFSLK